MRYFTAAVVLGLFVAPSVQADVPDPPPIKVAKAHMELDSYDQVVTEVKKGNTVAMFIGVPSPYRTGGYMLWAELPSGTRGIPDGEYWCHLGADGLPKMQLQVVQPSYPLPRFAPQTTAGVVPIRPLTAASPSPGGISGFGIRPSGGCPGGVCPVPAARFEPFGGVLRLK